MRRGEGQGRPDTQRGVRQRRGTGQARTARRDSAARLSRATRRRRPPQHTTGPRQAGIRAREPLARTDRLPTLARSGVRVRSRSLTVAGAAPDLPRPLRAGRAPASRSTPRPEEPRGTWSATVRTYGTAQCLSTRPATAVRRTPAGALLPPQGPSGCATGHCFYERTPGSSAAPPSPEVEAGQRLREDRREDGAPAVRRIAQQQWALPPLVAGCGGLTF